MSNAKWTETRDGWGRLVATLHVDLSAIFEAPYSPGLVLRRPGKTSTLLKRLKCALKRSHEIDSISSPSSMDFETLHCKDCDSYFDSAFFDATAEYGVRNGGGYDGTTYRIIVKDKS